MAHVLCYVCIQALAPAQWALVSTTLTYIRLVRNAVCVNCTSFIAAELISRVCAQVHHVSKVGNALSAHTSA